MEFIFSELNRAIEQLFGRLTGPMWFRFLMQPIMAIIIATRAGLKDARENKPAFMSEVLRNPSERKKLIHSLWKDLFKLMIVAFVLDSIYQILVLKYFYPVQALIVTFILAVPAYILFRGPVRRAFRRKYSKSHLRS
jgi:hypothetical protein